MPKKLLLSLLIVSNYCCAQTNVSTPFDHFINLEPIKWAAYNKDTVRFIKTNLSELLRNRLNKGEIKAVLAIGSRTDPSGKIIYHTKNEIDHEMPVQTECTPILDSLGNFVGKMIPSHPPTWIDSSNYNLVDVSEVFFVEAGKLRSYVAWVAPIISVTTSTGVFVGWSDHFSACINYKYNFKPFAGDKLLFLGQTRRKIRTDSIPRDEMLKELYGKNMIETIWDYLPNSKNEITNMTTGEKVPLKNLKEFSIGAPVVVPVYDSVGNIVSTKSVSEPTPPSVFKQIELTQNWYYDVTKNIVYNTIPEIVLFAKRMVDGTSERKTTPVIKIVFK